MTDKFPKMFCRSCGGGMPFNRKFLSLMWSATSFESARSRIRRQVRLRRKNCYRSISIGDIFKQPSLVCWKKSHGVRMHVRMLKRKLKNRPRKVRLVRRCFLSTFTLITSRSFIIFNFIYARKASKIQVRKLCKI